MAFLSLLPMRPRPLNDENLDSWAMRLAHANAATYFAKRVLRLNYYYLGQFDNRNDFQPIKALELATGLSYSKVVDTTFSHFQWKIPGKVYLEGKETVGSNSFHQLQSPTEGLLEHTHRVCPSCWKDDETPYIRKKCRLRFWRTCPVHNIFLIENCQVCGNTLKSSYRHYSSINNHGKFLYAFAYLAGTMCVSSIKCLITEKNLSWPRHLKIFIVNYLKHKLFHVRTLLL